MGEELKLPKKLQSMKNELEIAVRKKDDERTKRAIHAIRDYAENLKKIRAKPEAIKAAYDLTTPLGFGDPALEPQPDESGGRGRRGQGRGGPGRSRPGQGGPGRGKPSSGGAGRGGPSSGGAARSGTGGSGRKRSGQGGNQKTSRPQTRPQQAPPGRGAPMSPEPPAGGEQKE